YIERSRILEELRPGRLRASGYDYLIISSLFYTRYTKDPNFGVPGRAIIRELFRSMPIAAEFSAQHGTYGFHNPTLTLFDLRSKAHEER
ncbi:MAG: hypothetical protein J5J00_06485, partial [Deltaproteobacteria bacterium]|nr:hypothetical protein [Deltaproteobacteria bacterium]